MPLECPECGSFDVEREFGMAPNEEELTCQDCGHTEYFKED
jgi:predicted RNA-binding Zn-ribbon protein involved in translation (DUF1610 family)